LSSALGVADLDVIMFMEEGHAATAKLELEKTFVYVLKRSVSCFIGYLFGEKGYYLICCL